MGVTNLKFWLQATNVVNRNKQRGNIGGIMLLYFLQSTRQKYRKTNIGWAFVQQLPYIVLQAY
jgi:hypothetical protein